MFQDCDNFMMEMWETCSFFLAQNLNLEPFFCYPLIGQKVNAKIGWWKWMMKMRRLSAPNVFVGKVNRASLLLVAMPIKTRWKRPLVCLGHTNEGGKTHKKRSLRTTHEKKGLTKKWLRHRGFSALGIQTRPFAAC